MCDSYKPVLDIRTHTEKCAEKFQGDNAKQTYPMFYPMGYNVAVDVLLLFLLLIVLEGRAVLI